MYVTTKIIIIIIIIIGVYMPLFVDFACQPI